MIDAWSAFYEIEPEAFSELHHQQADAGGSPSSSSGSRMIDAAEAARRLGRQFGR